MATADGMQSKAIAEQMLEALLVVMPSTHQSFVPVTPSVLTIMVAGLRCNPSSVWPDARLLLRARLIACAGVLGK